MTTRPKKPHQVALCLFTGADLLDFTGPIEILSHVFYDGQRGDNQQAFEITQVASTPTILAGGLITITPNINFEAASKRIEDFDMLIVPGGMPDLLTHMATGGGPEVSFVKSFNALGQKGAKERIILSVCTGALLVAGSGALKGQKATTHQMGLDLLGRIDPTIDIVSHQKDKGVGRYVDGGRNENGVRMVTAGGVTCGLDASLYVAELRAGREAAELAARITEYEWKRA